MKNKSWLILGLILTAAFRLPAHAAETVCAVVNLELGQQAALEREGFSAKLALTNNLGDLPLSNLNISVSITDANGNAADHLFFTKITDLENIAAIDGTGLVQPGGKAVIKWLIIPSAGAGGTAASGIRYNATARMTYYTGGVPRQTTTIPAVITVKPQPQLRLEYVLPFEVFGDNPLTSVVESTEPFPLGLRVTNVGAGTAKSFQVASGQPQVTVNEQGLVTNFQIVGDWLGAEAQADKTFDVQFGDIAPGASKQAAWSLVSSLAGRFTDFTASFTHSAELGGALTSLIESAQTDTLIKDVLVDLPGRDAQFDFLINKSVSRSLLEAIYQQGEEPSPEFIMESDRAELIPVQNLPAHLTGALSGSNSVLRFAYDSAAPANTWVHSSILLADDMAPVLSAMRADGKLINPRNVWISKHYNKLTEKFVRHLHILDYTGAQAADYAMTFNAAALDIPPAAIADLAAVPAGNGALVLTWTASGEDGNAGTVYGGRYSIFYSTEAGVVPSSSSAQVQLATTTNAGAAQSYVLPGLLGNTTYQFAVYMADAQGQYSAVSNILTTQAAILPPAGIESIAAATGTLNIGWFAANNNSPVAYSIWVDTDAVEPVVAASPYKDAADRSFVFEGLTPNTTYWISGQAKNPDSGALSAQAYLGSTVTLAAQPGALVSSEVFVSSLTLAWDAAGNPGWTEYFVQLSTVPGWSPAAADSAWQAQTSYAFTGLAQSTTYYARVKAKNSAGIETAYTDLGAMKTGTTDSLPPVTEAIINGQSLADGATAFMAATDSVTLSAVDEGSGKKNILYTWDQEFSTQTATEYLAPFTLPVGTHTIYYTAFDNAGNQAAVKSLTVSVMNTTVACGATITENTLLTSDLDCTGFTGNAITIGADNITFDGGGHSVRTAETGLVLYGEGRSNISIKNIQTPIGSGKGAGIWLSAHNSLIENVAINGKDNYGFIIVGDSNIIRNIAVASGTILGANVSGNDVVVDSVTIVGGRDAMGVNGDRNLIENCDLSDNTGVALQVTGVSNRVVHNRLTNSAHGLHLYSSSGTVVAPDNLFTGSVDGILLNDTYNTTFENFKLDNLTGISGGTYNNFNLHFNNLDLSGNGKGTGIGLSAQDSLFENILVSSRDGVGMSITGNNNILRNITVSSGTALGVGVGGNDVAITSVTVVGARDAMGVTGDRNLIENCDLSDNTGIALQVTGVSNRVVHNRLTNSAHGLHLYSSSGTVVASDNLFTGSVDGILLNGTYNTTFENFKLDNLTGISGGTYNNFNLHFNNLDLSGNGKGTGIGLSAQDSLFENILVSSRDSVGLSITGNNNILRNITVSSGTALGVGVGGNDVLITSVTVTGARDAMGVTGDRNLIENCDLDNNTGDALRITSVSNRVVHNRLTNSAQGLHLYGSSATIVAPDNVFAGSTVAIVLNGSYDTTLENLTLDNLTAISGGTYNNFNLHFNNLDLSGNGIGSGIGLSAQDSLFENIIVSSRNSVGVSITGNNNILRNITVSSGTALGVGVGGNDVLIASVTVVGSRDAMGINGNHNLIENCDLSDNTGMALQVTAVANRVVHNRLTNSAQGLHLYSSSATIITPDNVFTGSAMGIMLNDTYNTTLENLTLDNLTAIGGGTYNNFNLHFNNLNLSGNGQGSGIGLSAQDSLFENIMVSSRDNVGVSITGNNNIFRNIAVSSETMLGVGVNGSDIVLDSVSVSGSQASISAAGGGHISLSNINISEPQGVRSGSGLKLSSFAGVAINNLVVANKVIGVDLTGVSSFRLLNATIVGNNTGISIDPTSAEVSIANSILWNNVNDLADASGSAQVMYSDVQQALLAGAGNIRLNPLFVDVSSGDLRLQAYSPCVDAGVNNIAGLPAKDLAGESRIFDGNGDNNAIVDMGAYENQASALLDIVPPVIEASINGQTLADGATAYINKVDTVTLSAVDDGSGKRSILYTLDTTFSTQTAVEYLSGFFLPVGTHTVYYTAFDNSGNQAAVKSFNVSVVNTLVTCGGTITESTVLTADLDCTGIPGYAITIGADNVTFDGGGHHIFAPDAYIVIAGTDRNGTIRNLKISGNNAAEIGVGVYGQNSIFENIALEGKFDRGMSIGGSSNTIRNVEVGEGTAWGVYVEGTDFLVDSVTVRGAGEGVRATGDHNAVINSDLSGNTGIALRVISFTEGGTRVSNNRLMNSATGLDLYTTSGTIITPDNVFTGSAIGIQLYRAFNTTFENLTLDNPVAIHSDYENFNIRFSSLNLTGTGTGTGMELWAYDSVFENIAVKNRSAFGMKVSGSSITLRNIDISSGITSGIHIEASDVMIDSVSVHGAQEGVRVNGDRNVVMNSDLSNNPGVAILVISGPEGKTRISNNLLTNSGYGLDMYASSGTIVTPDNVFAGSTVGIEIDQSFNTTLENLTLDNPTGIHSESENFNLRFSSLNLTGTGIGTGMSLWAYNSIFENITVKNRSIGGIKVSGSSITLRNIDISSGIASGIHIEASDVVVDSVSVHGAQEGVRVNGDRNVVMNSDLSNNPGGALLVISGPEGKTRVSNNLLTNSGYGLNMYTSSGTVITPDNVFTDSVIGIVMNHSSNIVLENLVLDNPTGIRSDYQNYDIRFSSLTLTGPGVGDGMELWAYNSIFENIKINGHTGYGMHISGTGDTVRNVDISSNTVVGIRMDGDDHIVDSVTVRGTGTGVHLAGDRNQVLNSDLSNNPGAAVIIVSGPEGKSRVSNNRLMNSGAGVAMYMSSGTIITPDNIFTGSEAGIDLNGTINTVFENLTFDNATAIRSNGPMNYNNRFVNLNLVGSGHGSGMETAAINSIFENIKVKGYDGYGLHIGGSSNTVRNVDISSTTVVGIRFDGDDNVVDSVTVRGTGTGVHLAGDRNQVMNSDLSNNPGAAVIIVSGPEGKSRVSNNRLMNSGAGVAMYMSSGTIITPDNTFAGSAIGIDINATQNTVIDGLTLENAAAIHSNGPINSNIRFANLNLVGSGPGSGIETAVLNSVFENITVKGYDGYGVHIGGSSITVRNVEVSSSSVVGMRLEGDDMVVDSVAVVGRNEGLRVVGDRNIVMNSNLSGNPNAALIVISAAEGKTRVVNNRLMNSGIGLDLYASSGTVITSDNLFAGSVVGIQMDNNYGTTIEDLTLDNPSAIIANGNNGVTFRNLNLAGPHGERAGTGLTINSSINTSVINVTVTNKDVGINLGGSCENVSLVNNTVANNDIGLLAAPSCAAASLENSIVWANNADIVDQSGSMHVAYSDVQQALIAGIGNINSDPLFVDASSGNLRLQANSPCVDSGTNTVVVLVDKDLSGNARVYDGNNDGNAVVDMGAYESQVVVNSSTPAMVSPSSAPIGMPFTITGSGFGAYSSGVTTVQIGGISAPLTLWSTSTIKGTIPGSLAAGEHAVAVMRGTSTIANAAPFIVTTPALYALTPSSGAIGVPFVITGESFGNYVANNTRVLIGGTTAPLTLWTDTRIQGTIPGSLAAGDNAVVVEREFNGNVVRTSIATFTVITPMVTEVMPSSGAIGVPFTITGANFGNYVANSTKVLIGGTTAPLSLWSDTKIQGTIPGSLAAGDYELVVQRELNGGITATAPAQFKVVVPALLAIIPSSGSIGVGFTLTGANFGNYVTNYTRVLIGGATAPLTLWSDSIIKGTVPGSLVSGTYDVAVERELNGGLVRTSTVAFTLVAPTIEAVAPSSGAIGVPFTITGASFGNYVANYTKVLIGGATAPLSLWSDTKIQGTVPGALTPGDYDLIVARELNGGVVTTQPMAFKVLAPEMAAITPSSGAIGVPFVITGANFGNYVANYTRVLIGGTTAPLSLWSDTIIKGTIPGGLTGGDNEVVVERALNGGVVRTSTFTFTLITPELTAVAPSSGPIGMPFVINGANFGNYVANYTKVLIGGATAPLSLWSDTKIQGTIPGSLAAGDYELVVVRNLNGGEVRTTTAAYTVTVPVINVVNPSTAAVMAPFTISGASFGNYVANSTKVLINGATAQLTVWTDTYIQGKLPFLLNGTYPVQVQRSLNGGLAETATAYITVVEPVISSMTPASGAVGTVFNLFGTGFGPYDANQTRVTIGGVACTLSLWSDTNIRGTVPAGLTVGTYTVVAMRGQALSNTLEYTVPGAVKTSMLGTNSTLAAEFKLGEVYVYPNPAKAGKVPVFHVEVGLADSVKIRIFTVTGQSVHEHTIAGVPQAIDGSYAYEYAWEGRITSGVYFYIMEAERAGKKLKAKGKFAVVR